MQLVAIKNAPIPAIMLRNPIVGMKAFARIGPITPPRFIIVV